MAEQDMLAAALSAVSVFDREYVEEGPWQVVGPVGGGYGIRAVEPKKFGGTVIVAAGLTKAFAERAVKEHAEAITPAWKKAAEAPAQTPPVAKKRKGKKS